MKSVIIAMLLLVKHFFLIMIVKIPLDFTGIKWPCYNDTYDDDIFKDHCTYKKTRDM